MPTTPERDPLAEQLAEAITITITIGGPGPRSELSAVLGASEVDGTYTKAEADYRLSDDPDVRCGECRYFHDEDVCDIVSGVIDEDDVCNYFEPKGIS